MRLNTRIKEYIYIHTHTVYVEGRPQNVNLYRCVGIHNMENSLGNRICVTILIVFKKTGLRIYQYKKINNNVKKVKSIEVMYTHIRA